MLMTQNDVILLDYLREIQTKIIVQCLLKFDTLDMIFARFLV